jgi:RimJ/RimL family protein N-acetyltransferase
MNETSKTSRYNLREATERDIPQLSLHHRKMFQEIWEKKNQGISNSLCTEIELAYSRKLIRELVGGSCKCWVIENGDQIVASGGITIVSFVPTPNDLNSRVAYLHSMYSEKAYRNKNFANRIVKEALQYCKANEIKRVILTASQAGKPIYEKIGFASSPETMRIFIE